MRMLLVAVLVLAGCKKAPTLEELTKLKEEACACKDLPCAQQVSDKIEAALKAVGHEEDLDDKQIAELMQAGMCTARLGVRDDK